MTNAQKRKQIVGVFGAYSKRLEGLYDDFIKKLSRLAIKSHVSVKDMLSESPLYHFDDYPELKQELNSIFSDYFQSSMLNFRAGITDGVALAYTQNNAVLSGFSVLSDEALRTARKTAANAFLRTRLKTATGLNLSQMVWNYCSQTKSEFEVAVSNVLADGLKKGTSAIDLAREVRQYLNNPDMMYRRYHRTVVDAQGNKKDIVRWRRRIVDENGKVRFVEQPLEKVGMGHYRSSAKNAQRLMRTEINMAYHTANYERWQKEPFVIGIRIDLSPEHPIYDECDELQGEYPKDFYFPGWHPQCLCMSNPITIQGEEKKEFYRRLAAGEDMSNYVSPNAVKEIPDSAKKWIADNHDKFVGAGERGKLGYVWRENPKYLRPFFSQEEQQKMGIFSWEKMKRVKAPEEKAAIIQRWHEHQLTRAKIEIKNARLFEENSPVITSRLKALKAAIETGDYSQISKALQEVRHGISIQRDVDFRHLHRDPDAIQKAWDERKAKNALIIKTGKNVWGVANNLGYKETLLTKAMLREAIVTDDIISISKLSKQLAKQVASINHAADEMGVLIPDIKTHLQSLTVSDLKPVYKGIEDKIAYLAKKYPGNYLEIAKKYEWEAFDYLGGNMYGVQQKYPMTWKISQQAYVKLAEDMKLNYEWESVEKILDGLKSFDTKSTIIKGYITDLEQLYANKTELAKAQQIAAKAEAKKESLINKRVKDRTTVNGVTDNGVKLKSVSEEKALKLIEDFEHDYSESMDDLLRKRTKKVWATLTEEEKVVVTKYTESYNYLNKPLREIYYSDYRTWSEFEHDMPILTRVLDKMKMPKDVVVRRGTGDFYIKALGKDLSQLQAGDEFIDGAFLSTAVRTDMGFFEDLNLVIVVPKGAKGIYAEPFSHFTDSHKYSYNWNLWNGKAKEAMQGEREWIGQRGSKFRVLKKQGDTLYLQMIGQMYDQTTDYRSFFHP